MIIRISVLWIGWLVWTVSGALAFEAGLIDAEKLHLYLYVCSHIGAFILTATALSWGARKVGTA